MFRDRNLDEQLQDILRLESVLSKLMAPIQRSIHLPFNSTTSPHHHMDHQRAEQYILTPQTHEFIGGSQLPRSTRAIQMQSKQECLVFYNAPTLSVVNLRKNMIYRRE